MKAAENALKNIEKIAEVGGYMKIEVKDALLQAVSEIRKYIELMNITSENKENESKKQSMSTEEDDSSTPVQLATSDGSSSNLQYVNQTPEPSDGKQRNPDENQMKYLSVQKGHKTTDTGEGARSDIRQKIDNIMDFLNNKLDKIIEEKIINHRNATTQAQLREKTGGDGAQIKRNYNTMDKTTEGKQRKIDEESTYEEEDDEDTWTRVTYGRNNRNEKSQKPESKLGTKSTKNEDIQAAQRYAWLFLGRLKEDTTPDKVKNYLQNNGIQGNLNCEEIESRGRNKAFKIGIPFEYLETVNASDFWPEGVLIKRYLFRRTSRNKGVSITC